MPSKFVTLPCSLNIWISRGISYKHSHVNTILYWSKWITGKQSVDCIQLFWSMVQQWAFVDMVMTLDSKNYKILKFSRNILHRLLCRYQPFWCFLANADPASQCCQSFLGTPSIQTVVTNPSICSTFCVVYTHHTYMHYLLLAYSMVQSPSWEANWFAASQEIPCILWNPKVHYCTHKHPPPVPILCQPNPVHVSTSHLLEIHPNIIHPSTHRSPQWSLSLPFPHQEPIRPPLLTHMRHMPDPSHSSRFYHPHNIGWGVQIIQLLVMQSPPFPHYLVPPRSKYSSQHHILKHPQLSFSTFAFNYLTWTGVCLVVRPKIQWNMWTSEAAVYKFIDSHFNSKQTYLPSCITILLPVLYTNYLLQKYLYFYSAFLYGPTI